MNERDQAVSADEAPGPQVVVGTRIVMARLDWDIMMHRVVMVLLGQLETRESSHFQHQRVRARRIREIAQVTQKSIHQEVARAAEKLDEATIGVWCPEKKGHERVPVFVCCDYKSSRGVLEARFAEPLREHVQFPEGRAVQYPLLYAMRLSTPYAIRGYEISKMIEQIAGRDEKHLPVSLFRRMFKLEGKYERHCDMRRRVIAPAVAEVSEKTDVCVQCRDVREGQTPIALRWQVQPKNEGRPPATRDSMGGGDRFVDDVNESRGRRRDGG